MTFKAPYLTYRDIGKYVEDFLAKYHPALELPIPIEGIKEGRFTKVRSSEEAARGKLEILKDYVRGISVNAKAKEAQQVLSAITADIDRLHPKED